MIILALFKSACWGFYATIFSWIPTVILFERQAGTIAIIIGILVFILKMINSSAKISEIEKKKQSKKYFEDRAKIATAIDEYRYFSRMSEITENEIERLKEEL